MGLQIKLCQEIKGACACTLFVTSLSYIDLLETLRTSTLHRLHIIAPNSLVIRAQRREHILIMKLIIPKPFSFVGKA